MGRLPNKPTNSLGTGAGLPEHLRPRAVSDPGAILHKPFKIPMRSRREGGAVRKARIKAPKSYALMDVDTNVIEGKKKNALRQKADACEDSRKTLVKRFSIPIKRHQDSPPPPPLGTKRRPPVVPRPLHDPMGEYAIVLYDPTVDKIPEPEMEGTKGTELGTKGTNPSGVPSSSPPFPSGKVTIGRGPHKSLREILGISSAAPIHPDVPVVIDPKLSKILRPHQVSGVQFLYRCTSGLVHPRAKGCIMADEMGLGKTLQCLTLMWTLLKQGPRGRKTIDKAIIVCPSSLVRNWANEIVKWLGPGVLTPLPIDGKSTKPGEISQALTQWALARGRNVVRPVLIISYETLRRNIDKLLDTEVGLLLADEGHRLKNGESQTFTALTSLQCERRVILSGTPIQNDLSEYFSLLNFANPGLLGSRNEFRKNYEIAILKGRDSLATDKEKQAGDAKLAELAQLVSKFIIRRTNDILSKYLPIKHEYVIFCNLAPLQQQLYDYFITSPDIKKLLRGVGAQPLKAIGILKKLCTHPNLLNLPDDIEGCDSLLPEEDMSRSREVPTWLSGKFLILQRFLWKIHRETNDKIVLISNYTQTLDLIEKMCRSARFGSLRLDGTMNINKRQKLVDKFNDPEGKEFIFLLSSKAGGCGINLIGANRLILLDPDWNPASDQQALARVWRDGQKKSCFIYRFIATGTIEEKIFQRQTSKLQLSSCVVDSNEDVERLFSSDNLKQLFQFNKSTLSETHDSFNCQRCNPDGHQFIRSPAMLYGDATTWEHVHRDVLERSEDDLMRNEGNFDEVSYCFHFVSHKVD